MRERERGRERKGRRVRAVSFCKRAKKRCSPSTHIVSASIGVVYPEPPAIDLQILTNEMMGFDSIYFVDYILMCVLLCLHVHKYAYTISCLSVCVCVCVCGWGGWGGGAGFVGVSENLKVFKF